jgi:DNA-binding NarL/FixJ family response regulator
VPTSVLASLLSHLKDLKPTNQGLTSRELEVLNCLALGASTEHIAASLYLSSHTVRNHVRNILTKLGAHSKLEAVAIAARGNVIVLGNDPTP